VYITTRDNDRGKEACQKVKNAIPGANVDQLALDLASFDSVDTLTTHLQQQQVKLDILICNAGAMVAKHRTVDGLDLQFQANYVSHALLVLQAISKQLLNPGARIIHVSSLMHNVGQWPLSKDVLSAEQGRSYNRLQMYNNTKLYQIMFSNELHRRLRRSTPPLPYTTVSLHPGVANTEFLDHFIPVWFHNAGNWIINAFIARTNEQSAETTLYTATAPQLENVSGIYLDNCQAAVPMNVARDERAGRDLWRVTRELLGKYAPQGELFE
jgi:retinol dehydrogenase-12